ncbi:transposase [Myroides marinus]|uniref:transposase n=1 Tax=Myroides marinus TaxID=703342 RepID=UPI00374241B8
MFVFLFHPHPLPKLIIVTLLLFFTFTPICVASSPSSFNVHYNEIINYFNNRSTNASVESFNSKIKYFRIMMYRGVIDKKFFF